MYERKGKRDRDESRGQSAGIRLALFDSVENGLLDKENQIDRLDKDGRVESHRALSLVFSSEMEYLWRIIGQLCEHDFAGEAEDLYVHMHEFQSSLMRWEHTSSRTTGSRLSRRRYIENCKRCIGNLIDSLHDARDVLINRFRQNGLGELVDHEYVFAKKVDWVICFNGQVAFLGDTLRGPVFIQYLLKHQGTEVHVARMLADIAGDKTLRHLLAPSEVTDEKAIADTRKRHVELQGELEEARKLYQVSRQEELLREQEGLTTYLANAVGLFDNPRPSTDGVGKMTLRATLSITARIPINIAVFSPCGMCRKPLDGPHRGPGWRDRSTPGWRNSQAIIFRASGGATTGLSCGSTAA